MPWVRKKLLADPHRLGRWGQKRAEAFLKRQRLRTLARNFAFSGGELDLVMGDRDGTIVFIEVKTRRDETIAPAHAAVNRKKRHKMYRTARIFLKTYRVKDKPLRFDVVTVILGETWRPEIRHYENAFVP